MRRRMRFGRRWPPSTIKISWIKSTARSRPTGTKLISTCRQQRTNSSCALESGVRVDYLFGNPTGSNTRGDGINDSNLVVGRYLQAGSTTLYDGYKATN